MTFKNFLEQYGYTVETAMQQGGEIYIINGTQVNYKDIPKSKYAGILRQYLLLNK